MSIKRRKEFDEDPSRFHLDYSRLPSDSKKYWRQRYQLFRRFDQGIYMNEELWYSVTPESVAIFVAKFLKACAPNLNTICDVFCGGGGNSIQFARKFEKVIAIDCSEEHLYCTEKNCEIYGVGDKVELKLGDWTEMQHDRETMQILQDEVDLVFASPPWGGPDYKNGDLFDLNLLIPLPINELLESFFRISRNVVLFLPKNSDLAQLSQVTRDLLGEEAHCRVIYVYTDGFIKGIIAIWGEKFMPEGHDYSIPLDCSPQYRASEDIDAAENPTVPAEDFYDEKPSVQQYSMDHNYFGYDQDYYHQDEYQNLYQKGSHQSYMEEYQPDQSRYDEADYGVDGDERYIQVEYPNDFDYSPGDYVEELIPDHSLQVEEIVHFRRLDTPCSNDRGETVAGAGGLMQKLYSEDSCEVDDDDLVESDFTDANDYPDLDVDDQPAVNRLLRESNNNDTELRS